VDVPVFSQQTGYKKKNMFIGSCFTENIGNRMVELKYNVDVNPFGILYNPVSVAKGLRILLENQNITSEDLVQANGLWHSFYHHGRFSATNKKEVLEEINSRIKLSADFLKTTDFLCVTFGTAWVYRYKKTGQFVSNCHKLPATEFDRVRLTIAEIVSEYRTLLTEIRKLNPSLKVVFTVSPIRHWKDGAIENQLSKAVLLLAIDDLIHEFGDDFCVYFPAYEIVMDELRDYRFYAEDMIHISEVTVNYIWEKFEASLIDNESQLIAVQVRKIVNAYNHRPIHKKTKEYMNFLKKMAEEAVHLESKYKYLNLIVEKEYFMAEKDKFE
ncbi:MAG TPA: GSCFA domain-containing protein, partial [Draconibacterium sp.]|nr:GSCFA domain-containing protein [Draconibacterium sp.]